MSTSMESFSRRSFLQRSSVAAAAALVCNSSSTGWASAAPARVAGIQLYMVKDDLAKDPAGTLGKIATMGYREVETAGTGDLTAAAFRKLIDTAGLHCPSAHLFFGFQETGKLLEDAHALGVNYVVSSVLLPKPPTTFDIPEMMKLINSLTLDDFKQIAALANKIAEQAKAAGFQYAYHNHNFEFRDQGGKSGYQVLLEETDPALVKFEADCGWMMVAGADPVDFFHSHPGRYRMVHVKDFIPSAKTSTSLGPDSGQTPTELGRGHIDYRPILAQAKKAGVEHYFVEQEPPVVGMTPLEAAKVDYDYLHKVLH